MRAIWNEAIIAQSDDIVEVEGNAYFPLSALDRRYVRESDTHTICSWKGQASYFSVQVGDKVNRDAAWYYPDPKPGAESVADRVAFWKGVRVIP
jgi:uncharacterized protein (DUF427 family)